MSSCVTEKKDIEKEFHRLQQTDKQKWEQKKHDLHGFNSGKKMKQTRKNADVSKRRTTLKRSIANTQRLGIFSSLFLTYRTDDNRIYIFF